MAAYTEIIEYANLKIAVCGIVGKDPKYYRSNFDMFYPYIKERFLTNYDELVKLVSSKPKKKAVLKTGLYAMNLLIDYHSLIDKLEQCKNSIDKKIDIEK